MITIRFARVGKRNKAQFKIVLQDSKVAPGGAHVEVLGSYDPHVKNAILKEDRIKYWIGKGAQTSDTVYNLLVSKGVIEDKKRAVKLPKKAEEPKEESKAEDAKVEEVKAEPASPAGEETKIEEKVEEVKSEEKAENKEEVKSE